MKMNKKRIQQITTIIASAFTLLLVFTINGAMAEHKDMGKKIPTNETVLDQPDLTALEHMDGEYFSQCQVLTGKNDEYTEFDTNLQDINASTFEVIKHLSIQNKKIRKAVADISKALAKINSMVVEKNIRRSKKKVLKEMESLKKQLQGTRKAIEQIKELVDDSQRTMGNTYCRVDQYVNLYLAQAEEAGEEQLEGVARFNTSTAAQQSGKRQKLYNVMMEFDRYFGLLDLLFKQARQKFLLISSTQMNIVSFVDTQCRDKSAPCKCQPLVDLRFNEAQLADIIAKTEEAFSRLILTARSNFSGDKLAQNKEVSHAQTK